MDIEGLEVRVEPSELKAAAEKLLAEQRKRFDEEMAVRMAEYEEYEREREAQAAVRRAAGGLAVYDFFYPTPITPHNIADLDAIITTCKLAKDPVTLRPVDDLQRRLIKTLTGG